MSADPIIVFRLPSEQLAEGASVAFSFEGPDEHPVDALCVRYGGVAYAYLNICPHWRISLDMDDENFWASQGDYLVCSNHGATFRPDDGYCESGPCFGGSLTPLPLEEQGGVIEIREPEWPKAWL